MRFKLLLSSFLATMISFGQSFSNNPSSYYGFGQFIEPSNAIYSAFGHNSINILDSTQLNTVNPSSYSYLSNGNTLFFLGASGKLANYSSSNSSESVNRSSFLLDQYALGFNVLKGLGMGVGLRPFAQKGYTITEQSFTGLDSVEFKYEGLGGLNEVFYGVGYMPLSLSKFKLSFGANLSYLFGKTSNSRQARLNSSAFPYGEALESLRLNALKLDISSSLDILISKSHRLLIAGVYTPEKMPYNLTSIEMLSNVALGSNGRPTFQVLNSDTLRINYSYNKFSLGFNYAVNLPKWRIQNKELHPHLDLMASYSMASSQINYTSDASRDVLWNMQSFRFGIQFRPEINLFENATLLKFAERISYRLGYYTHLNDINGAIYNDNGITFGFGLPTLIQRSLSSVNLSFQLGKNSKVDQGLKELYGSMQLGIVFAPSSFEKWFIKRKLD